jgi:hypothetical protein
MASIYKLLNGACREFRRLILRPGEPRDPIICSLDTSSLDDGPEYEALSYVWGQDMAPDHLSLEGTTMPITSNLDVALRHLRLPAEPRMLWVDALCINQNDLDERAEQVRLMHTIYGTASTVLVWLGAAADGSDDAMRSIDRFDKAYWQTYEFQLQFMRVLYRPWFTRIWVVQEFVLGKKDPKFGCGNIWVHWISFITAWAHFRDNLGVVAARHKAAYRKALLETFEPGWVEAAQTAPTGPEVVPSDPVLQERILTGLRATFEESKLQELGLATMEEVSVSMENQPATWRARYQVMRYCQYESPEARVYFAWLELSRIVPLQYHGFLTHARGTIQIQHKPLLFETILKGTMNLRSTDARDKIYGILGLVSDDARKAIPIDYRKPAEWTFVPTVAYMVRHEPGSLALLGLLWSTRPFNTSIPSWVPDFTISADWTDPRSPVLLRGSCMNAPWKGWDQDVHISDDLVAMAGLGISLGQVKQVIRFPASGDITTYVNIIQSIETLVAAMCPDNEPLWRTLVGVHNTGPPPPPTEPSLDQRFEVLMGRSPHKERLSTSDAGYSQKLFQDSILPVIAGRVFFTTDAGFAGVATPDIEEGDLVGLVFGLLRPAVMRVVRSNMLKTKSPLLEGACYRITGFCYLGCKDRADFERQEKEGLTQWNQHLCFNGQEVIKFNIV